MKKLNTDFLIKILIAILAVLTVIFISIFIKQKYFQNNETKTIEYIYSEEYELEVSEILNYYLTYTSLEEVSIKLLINNNAIENKYAGYSCYTINSEYEITENCNASNALLNDSILVETVTYNDLPLPYTNFVNDDAVINFTLYNVDTPTYHGIFYLAYDIENFDENDMETDKMILIEDDEGNIYFSPEENIYKKNVTKENFISYKEIDNLFYIYSYNEKDIDFVHNINNTKPNYLTFYTNNNSIDTDWEDDLPVTPFYYFSTEKITNTTEINTELFSTDNSYEFLSDYNDYIYVYSYAVDYANNYSEIKYVTTTQYKNS